MKRTKETAGSSNNGTVTRKPKAETILGKVSARFALTHAVNNSGNIALRKQIIRNSERILKGNK